MKMRWMTAALLLAFACDSNAFETPKGPDAGPLGGLDDPCETVWDCESGLTCSSQGLCRPPPQQAQQCNFDWHCELEERCVDGTCQLLPDASVPDASVLDANSLDAGIPDATAGDDTGPPRDAIAPPDAG